jgi:hypothetical protein
MAARSEYGLAAKATQPDEVVRRALDSVTPENGPGVADRQTDEPPTADDIEPLTPTYDRPWPAPGAWPWPWPV